MKFIISLLLCLSYSQVFSKDYKVLALDDHSNNNHFSFEFDFGAGKSFTSIYTGFDVDNGSIAMFFPSSGFLVKLAGNFFHGDRLTYGVSYTYQIGGLNNLYDNGGGDNVRNIVTPSIRYAPILFNKGKINLGIGLNAVLSTFLKVEAEQPEELQSANYRFKKTLGPTFFIEYQENVNDWLGGRVGLSYNFTRYELDSFSYNDVEYGIGAAPYEMQNHSASSLDLYIGFYIYF